MARGKKPSVGRRVARPGKNTPVSTKMQIGLRRGLLNRAVLFAILAATFAVAVIGGSLALYYKAYADPKRVFNDMINNNLATRGFSKQMIKHQASGSSDESLQLIFSPSIQVRDIRRLDLTDSHTKVLVETIGTTKADYQHYLSVKRTLPSGKRPDYTRLYKLWVKNGEGSGGDAQLVDSAFFGATLFGNLDPASRHQITSQLKPAYIVDYKNVKKQSINHRRTYTYDTTVLLRSYAQAARQYAQDLDLPIANQIQPSLYPNSAKLHVQMTVDVLSRQLLKVDYFDQGLTETYSGYGTAPQVPLPKKTVTPEQLTQVLNSIQQQ
jgi:hypothetical protein